jgi:hypothetical protein
MTSGAGAFGRDRSVWLAVGLAVATGLAAGLAAAPPGLTAGEARTTSIFAALVSIAIVSVSILPFVVWRSAWRRLVWVSVASLALALGAISFAAGGYAQRACTARYAGRAVMIGSELSILGATYARDNPQLSNDELLFDSAGVAERVWTRRSIDRCRTLVGSTYFLWMPFLAVCVLAVVQAMPASALVVVPRHPPAATRGGETAAIRYDVFISYRHGARDTAFARQLLASLEADGYVVAIDERDFPANASFLQEMERCIRESRFTVAVMSARYFDSDNTQEEAIITKVLDMSERKRRLIPLIIEPVAMPAWLYGIVGVNFTAPDPLIDPLDRLKSTLGTPLHRLESGG